MKYNRSLDYIALAMAHGSKGNAVTASKLFAKALAAPDAARGLAILEASNSEAFEKAQKAKVAAKIKPTQTKAQRIKASEDLMEDEDLMEEDEVDAGMEDEDLDLSSMEEIDAEFEDEDAEEESSFDEQFAKVLANMNKKAKRK